MISISGLGEPYFTVNTAARILQLYPGDSLPLLILPPPWFCRIENE